MLSSFQGSIDALLQKFFLALVSIIRNNSLAVGVDFTRLKDALVQKHRCETQNLLKMQTKLSMTSPRKCLLFKS